MLADFFAALGFAYVGMLALCQGLERHYKQVWGSRRRRSYGVG